MMMYIFVKIKIYQPPLIGTNHAHMCGTNHAHMCVYNMYVHYVIRLQNHYNLIGAVRLGMGLCFVKLGNIDKAR